MIEIQDLFHFENEMLSIILETMLKYSGILIIIAFITLYFTKLLSIIPMFLIISNKLYSYILKYMREREKEKVSIFILSSLLVQNNNKAFLK